jgi:hypothetical protein
VNAWYGSAVPSQILISQNDVADILSGAAAFYIYGYIEYTDVAEVLHKHRFAYRFEWGDGDISERFRPAGPDSYREYT